MKTIKLIMSIALFILTMSSSAQWTTSGVNNTYSNANTALLPIFGTVTNQSLQIRTNNINRINIGANGNIGFGTTNTTRRMQIHGTGSVTPEPGPPSPILPGSESLITITNQESGSTAWDGLRIGIVGNDGVISYRESSNFQIRGGNNSGITPAEMTFRPDGRLVLFAPGSIIPDSRLSMRVSGANGFTIDNPSNPSGYSFRVLTNSNETEALSVRNGSTTRFVVKGNGRVGIGTNSPSNEYLLDVAGKARACEVRVNNPGWCDYVFEPTYNLMPLADLRSYLSENKHLPEMPSEKEVVEAGGFDLAQMNVALLKRSEENTLYILELEEKINKLAKVVETQTKLIQELTTKSTSNE
jgi:hypothetical protein